jgi:hypothetical protein
VWPVAIEPYRLITVALLSERAEARVRSRLLGPIPDEIADEVRRVAGPA